MLPIVVIRKARIKDVPEVVRLWRELIDCHIDRCGYGEPLFRYRGDVESKQKGYFSSTIRSKNGLILVAEEEGEVVGFICASIKKLSEILVHNKEAHIHGVYIRKGYRRKGIGRRFFKEVRRWAKGKGAFSMGLMVSVRNKDALKGYRRLGFEEHHLKMSRIV